MTEIQERELDTKIETLEKEIYNIPYKVDGNHQNLYEGLVDSDTSDVKVKNIIFSIQGLIS